MTEFELIERLKRRSDRTGPLLTGIGDDASVAAHRGPTATSVDAVVEGVHFDRRWSGPGLIAHKAVATALSDLAAMAADPGEIYVTLGLPAGLGTGFMEELADGFLEMARRYDVSLAGGDTVSSPVLFVAVTAVGRVPEGEEFILRSGAEADDLVAVTGRLGGAAAGLLLLNDDRQVPGLTPSTRETLVSRQLAPEPRLLIGRSLRGSGVTSLIDLSDGLAADLGHLSRMSGVAIEVECELLPIQDGVAEVAQATGEDRFELALAGGEDYELAMTVAGEAVDDVRARVKKAGGNLTVVGAVSPGTGVSLLSDGSPRITPAGFDHLV